MGKKLSSTSVFLYDIIVLFHCLIWLFVLTASFISDTLAKYNVAVIAVIYLLHALLPFHILESSKASITKDLNPDELEQFKKRVHDRYYIFFWFQDLQIYLEKRCFLSPINAQGMMIFGLLVTCIRGNVVPP
jgi:hypothetical protein